ncbi:MAG: SDR family NAD(P)-dependent oxidoreductase [Caulobacterales bacterium]
MNRLKGRVAVITGACSGIGLGATELFVSEGAKVLAADIQDDKGRALAARFDGQVAYRHCNVMDESDIAGAMQGAVDAFGRLDILFNNAGAGGSPNTIAEMTGDAWDFSQDLLLRSVALGIRYAIAHMKKVGGGSIINTASIAGTQAGAGPIAYSVAKAGVVHLTRCAAAELGRDGIRVNAICPGLILTEIFTPADRVPPGLAEIIKASMRQNAYNAQPIAKPGLPEDIAKACLFFASDDSLFVTGTHLLVDGGMHTGPRQAWDPEARAERQRIADERRAAWEAGLKLDETAS